MRDIGVGIIGTGFMGKAHALAYRAVAGIFPGSLRPVLTCVADIDRPAAERAAGQLGFSRWSADWRSLIEDPEELGQNFPPDMWQRGLITLALCLVLLWLAQRFFSRVENKFPERL